MINIVFKGSEHCYSNRKAWCPSIFSSRLLLYQCDGFDILITLSPGQIATLVSNTQGQDYPLSGWKLIEFILVIVLKGHITPTSTSTKKTEFECKQQWQITISAVIWQSKLSSNIITPPGFIVFPMPTSLQLCVQAMCPDIFWKMKLTLWSLLKDWLSVSVSQTQLAENVVWFFKCKFLCFFKSAALQNIRMNDYYSRKIMFLCVYIIHLLA